MCGEWAGWAGEEQGRLLGKQGFHHSQWCPHIQGHHKDPRLCTGQRWVTPGLFCAMALAWAHPNTASAVPPLLSSGFQRSLTALHHHLDHLL